ncbi:MAG: hypothetical protein JSS46_13730 [Proteobacteria bacterium]|jgi:Cu/Zn superoxide dismutase|nr:hypothetical protein [Pseudomonadota bacterium]
MAACPLASRPARPRAGLAACALAAAALAGCATTAPGTDSAQKAGAAANAGSLGQVAQLRAIGGSAVSGKVTVVDRGDGAVLTVAAFNIPTGPYRLTINRNANCTSPNGFSAGPAWAPPGAKRAPADLVGVLRSNDAGSTDATVHVPGLRATGPDGVAGHSVILYAGHKVTEAVPDVPNDRVACGVFEVTRPLQF